MSIAIRYAARRAVVKAALAGFVAWPAFAAERPRLVLLGNSLTAGYGLAQADGFAAQLQRALDERGYAVAVIDAGVSGDTTAGGLARLDWVLGEGPGAMLVELGANDALRGIPPEATHANLEAILTRLGEAGVKAVLAGMRAPRNLGTAYVTAFDAIFPRLAERHGVPLYPFFLEGVALDPALNQADGIHPNAAGVARIVAGILPVLAPVLDGLAEP